ncbi:MAG: hypothetical protein V5A87_01505 [Candidatus Bipolaricaulota bacterium]
MTEYPNPVLETLLNHKSIRNYRDKTPSDETIVTIVCTGQHAPFVTQMYSILLTRRGLSSGSTGNGLPG